MTDGPRGLIFDIQGYSVHDGPGCRTAVFMKGCPLHCAWCSNPEGISTHPELLFKASKCVHRSQGCSRCLPACPYGAIRSNPGAAEDAPPLLIDRRLCRECQERPCAAACYFEALQVCGRWITIPELLRLLNRDRQYWGGNGGVTFTGGEPLLQHEFILGALQACRQATLHTAVETTAVIEPHFFLEVMQQVDFAFIDLKHMDPGRHQELTGHSNAPVLANLRRLVGSGWPGRLVLRMPVIDGFNDDEHNILAMAALMHELKLMEVNLLPFHRLGASKWAQVGVCCPYAGRSATSEEKLAVLQRLFLEQDILCYAGDETPF